MIGTAQAAAPISVSSVAQLTLSLGAIVAFIFAIGWALKRFKVTSTASRGDMAVIDQLAVGPRERILLIRVGESQVLIGVGAAGLVGLTPLATPISTRPETPAPVFADRLRELLKRPGGPE